MILFFNQFISYLIIVLVSMGIIVLAVFLGKKWRDAKDAKDAKQTVLQENDGQSEEV